MGRVGVDAAEHERWCGSEPTLCGGQWPERGRVGVADDDRVTRALIGVVGVVGIVGGAGAAVLVVAAAGSASAGAAAGCC